MSSRLIRNLVMRDGTLSQASRQRMLDALTTTRVVRAGEDIVTQGSRPSVCTLVVEGWAGRYNRLSNGRRQMVALHVPGDLVDLHSFPLKIMDHGVTALTDCTLAAAPHARIREITESDPHLARLLWLLTTVDAAILRRWLLGSGQQPALENTAHLICELFTRLQVAGLATLDRPFELPLSQEVLGDALGISSVHVSRTLTELRSRNLFHWRRGEGEILDWPALRSVAEFDAGYLSLMDEPR